MKIRLVFMDWVRNGESIYLTEEGEELSRGDFHSGTVFDAEIVLDEEQQEELKAALAKRAIPVFQLILG